MQLHRSLKKLTVWNFFIATIFFYAIDKIEGDEARGINTYVSWVIWIIMFAIAGPVFFDTNTRQQWFCKEYFWGTWFLAFVNLLLVIAAGILGNWLSL